MGLKPFFGSHFKLFTHGRLWEAKVLVQWFCPGNSLVHRDILSRKQPSQVIETERPDLYRPNVKENGTAHRSRKQKLVWMSKDKRPFETVFRACVGL
jgi:hypothetical protein